VIPALLLAGCLPRHALGRADEVMASRYTLEIVVAAEASGDLPPVVWGARGDVVFAWTRTFRDGTEGHAALFEHMVGPDGAPLWEGAVVEVRTFPNGEIVAIDGLAPWSGTGGHLELVDVLWPALSPRVPGAAGDATGVAAWPVLFPQGPGARFTVSGTWDRAGATVSWSGPLTAASTSLHVEGETVGTFTRDRAGLVRAHVQSHRHVAAAWPAQEMTVTVDLTRVGLEAAPALDPPYPPGDATADARPLRYADGRVVARTLVAPEQLAFLLADADTSTRIRATLAPPRPTP
jgi:hypothetical protein